ncbi:hypothetical protein [Streptomyces sp. NPDC059176]|uniref:hypothetical protein n=1 Tax=Streptomyces sp. NPDC059176 TaxID=3346758 RepID=UPI0036967FF0
MIAAGASLPLDLADAIKQQAVAAGAETSAIRGGDWRLAVVATVNSDGTIVTSDGITARRTDTYVSPTVGDLIRIDQSSYGNWWAIGRGSTGTFAIGEAVTKYKTSDTPRSSTTSISADPHLSINVVPGTYRVDALIVYTADTAADLKLGWFAPGSTTGAWWPGGSDSGNTTFAATTRWGAPTDFSASTLPVAGVGSSNVVACRPTGTAVVVGTGQISLAWAQQSSSATATTVRTHSWLELRRID